MTRLPSTDEGQEDVVKEVHNLELEIVNDDEIVDCICGHPESNGETIECEKCLKWSHEDCYLNHADDYTCAKCTPEDYDDTAMTLPQEQPRDPTNILHTAHRHHAGVERRV